MDLTKANIDWKLLCEQKIWLLFKCKYGSKKDREMAEGLLHFIDHLQDAAVDSGLPETTVFDHDFSRS